MPIWDDRTFYDFIASSEAFSKLSFYHREVFGQVGFGTGGWDCDFPNSTLEIFRVVMINCDENERLIVGGAEQVPRGLVGARAVEPYLLAGEHRPGIAAFLRHQAGCSSNSPRRQRCSSPARAGY